MDHKQGSDLLPSFIVPVDILEKNSQVLRSRMKPIPEAVIGTSIRGGTPSPNGHFLVVAEKGKKDDILKILTLQGAHSGGLTCATRAVSWEAKIRGAGAATSTISIHVEEQKGALEIVATDGRGHIAFARVSVPDLLPCEDHMRFRRDTFELCGSEPIRELSCDESSRHSVATFELWSERAEVVPG